MTDTETMFTEAFLAEIEERKERTDYPPEEWRAGGRASKAWPNKEDSTWWMSNGPTLLQKWIDWWEERKAEGWAVWIAPGNVPAVELEVKAHIGGTMWRCFIDTVLVDPDGDLVIVDWKGLATFTPIPTPSGWKTMGELEVGDQVFGSNGRPCSVVGKSEVKQLPCYRVKFDDGTSIVCDHEHLWYTVAGYNQKLEPGVRGIEEIRRTLRNPVTGQRQHRVPNAQPLVLPDADLPIDPYVLGVWLADGKATGSDYTKPDAGIAEEVRRRGFEVRKWNTRHDKCAQWNIIGLAPLLRANDLFDNKHIPSVYLRGSIQQRVDLLRGLMDGDGTWNRKRKQAEFFNTDKALAEAVYELAASLGERPYLNAVQKKGFGLEVTCYEVKWAPSHYNPFHLFRKANLVTFKTKSKKGERRLIVDVEVVPTVNTQCISVDSPDNTYLCGEQMVPTHNTGSMEPVAPIQLGTNALAMEKTLGVRPKYGAFFMAKKTSDLSHIYDLDIYDEKTVGPWAARAAQMERQSLFIPHPSSLCNACGVKEFCKVMGGERADEVPDF